MASKLSLKTQEQVDEVIGMKPKTEMAPPDPTVPPAHNVLFIGYPVKK